MYRLELPGWNRTCQGLSRRSLLHVGAVGSLGFSLADLYAARESRAAGAGPGEDMACIMLFLWGGPPQHELWDPKPEAPEAVRGPLRPIPTSVDGIRIGELLPRMAGLAHQYVIVRSAHHADDVHGNGCHATLTGMAKRPNVENPNVGAVLDRFSASRGPLPSFVTVGPVLVDAPVLPTGQEGGFLGNAHGPFRVVDPLAPVERQAALSPPPGVTLDRLRRRDTLYRRIDQFQARVESGSTAGYDRAYERAVSLTTSPQAKEAFDLAREPDRVRDRYGRHTFGQGCLLARRLVEAGVRYVQVNWADHPINNYGFDNHSDNLNRLKGHQLPVLDQACSALIEDLVQRGMYQKTLLIITGEFGRTPKVNQSAGRDHWPWVYSYVIAGAGILGGRVIGSSDAEGAYPASLPISPEMRAASVFRLMGLDTTTLLRSAGVLSDAEGIPRLFGET